MTPPTSRDAGRTQNPMSSISGTATPPVNTHDSDPCAVRTAGLTISTRMTTIWDRSKAKISRLLGKVPAEVWSTHESTCRLPYEIVEMITAHLTRDLRTLKACSLTCRSWYSATAPLLHHTLTLVGDGHETNGSQLEQLSKLHELGLVPLVKEIRMKQSRGDLSPWFAHWAFNDSHLSYFYTLANVHTLRLQELDIHLFIPGSERYFGHFSPTLRSITLFNPRCTPRQLSHFLSLFTNLDNIAIRITYEYVPSATIDDTQLVLFSKPKFQGRLLLYDFRWVDTWMHLITWCDGLQFHYVDLHWSESCVPMLLEACAETLGILRFSSVNSECCVGLSTDSS